MASQSAPFTCVTAFASKPFEGNPAAVIFLDPLATPQKTLHGLALNFNAPMAAFVKPVEALQPGQTTIQTDIRFVTITGTSPALCGHGALAAAKALLACPNITGKGIAEIQFRTLNDQIITVWVRDAGFLELELPSSSATSLPKEEEERIRALVNRAWGRDVKVNHIAAGEGNFKHALMIEIDETEDLAGSKVNTSVFSETRYGINTVTSAIAPGKRLFEEQFVSRMFSPVVPGGEDHVCGSAHCLLIPYWYNKHGVESGKQIVARQVSERGGVLKVTWDGERKTIRLCGEATIISTGVCYF
ncbi:hypothetical protein D9611_005521 [Ephemerocybe angulata]|uniref:Diaminopimelate epimerase-like protein n=1 Tax=Ephemerocybe angulata TaxID=980116 RepID=A0A8H5BHM7_9AGAR|nr:hypothetical protein D9611_005521 [Tulosesus angulatus]